MRLVVLSDGRRGIENQALGLSEAMARHVNTPCEITRYVLCHGKAFAALPPRLQYWAGRFDKVPPGDVLIGCGRQAIAPLLWIRKHRPAAKTVYVQDPRLSPSHFDFVVAPEHDHLSGPNVETMIGSPNRITQADLNASIKIHATRLAALPAPHAMMAIGGPSRSHEMDAPSIDAHFTAARQLRSQNHSLLITTSRRTPAHVAETWRDFARANANVWLHTPDSEGENPYFAFLAVAQLILVTEESTNMLTEACSTGKPTFRLPMGGDPGKFRTLYAALEKRCLVTRFGGDYDLPSYPPLEETDRVAKRLVDQLELA